MQMMCNVFPLIFSLSLFSFVFYILERRWLKILEISWSKQSGTASRDLNWELILNPAALQISPYRVVTEI